MEGKMGDRYFCGPRDFGTGYDMMRKIEDLEAEVARLENVCKAWADVSQRNYQRAKAAEDALAKVKP
jgi:hypothetical protein